MNRTEQIQVLNKKCHLLTNKVYTLWVVVGIISIVFIYFMVGQNEIKNKLQAKTLQCVQQEMDLAISKGKHKIDSIKYNERIINLIEDNLSKEKKMKELKVENDFLGKILELNKIEKKNIGRQKAQEYRRGVKDGRSEIKEKRFSQLFISERSRQKQREQESTPNLSYKILVPNKEVDYIEVGLIAVIFFGLLVILVNEAAYLIRKYY